MNREIRRVDWPTFADEFSEANQGRRVTLELVGQVHGDEIAAEKAPLIALDFDDEDQGTILITVGEGEDTMTHSVAAPETIWLRIDDAGEALALEIVAADGPKTILNFEHA